MEVMVLKVLIPFNGQSQYAPEIKTQWQGSACGPVTAAAILQHYGEKEWTASELYRLLGATRIGLFTWRFVRKFAKLTSGRYDVHTIHSIDEVKKELIAGRPLAVKFDRWFSFHWFSKPMFNYHWVPLVGFEEQDEDLILYIHDNGKRNRPSKLRAVSYHKNRKFLTFVKIVPIQKD